MKKQDKSVSDSNNIRQKAEKLLKNKPLEINTTISESEALRLLHELQVYQIELELQNEELKVAKDEAEVASQKYTELYDFAPSGYFTLSEEGNIRELNFSGAHMLGKERRYLMNSSFELFVSEETKPIFNLFLQRIFNNKIKETCEVILSLKDNPSMYVYLTGIVTQKGDQCVLNAVDISERKHAEQALREEEERNHDLILHTSMDGFLMFDKHGSLLEVNETYCQMSGYPLQELLTMRISDLETVEAIDDIESQIKKVIVLGATCFETRQRRKDGRIFNVEVSIQYRPVNEGQFVAFIHDITGRKQAEKALFESNEQFRLLFEYSGEAILFTRPDGTICSANPEACKIFGRSEEEIQKLGRGGVSDLSDPRLLKAVEERKKTGYFKGELNLLRRDGTIFPAEISTAVFKDSKGAEKTSMFARDITERKQAEVKLQQSEKLYRDLFNTMIEGFSIIEVIFDENQKAVDYLFLETNAVFEEQSGLRNVEGKLMRTMTPDHEQYWFDLYGEIALTGEMMRFEREAAGLNRWFDVCAFRIGGSESRRVAVCFSDISERKKAEVALQKSEKSLSDIYSSMSEGISVNEMIYDTQGKAVDYLLVNANPAFEKITGQKLSEVMGLSVANRYAMEQAPYFDIYAQVAATGEPASFEILFPPLNKYLSVSAFSPGKGKFVVLFRDITEIKLAEKALFESNEQFQLLFENSPDAIFFTNPDGSILSVNPGAERMLGWSKEEILGLGRYDISNENDPRLKPALEERRKTGSFKGELTYLRKDGTIFPVDFISNLYTDSNGIARASIVARDISERKKAEQIIKESEKRRNAILQTAMDGYFLLDTDGRLLEVNETYCQMSGYSKQELLSMHIFDLDNIGTVDDIADLIKNIVENGESRFETCHRRKDGSIFDIEASVQFQPGEGGQLVVFMHDITERKHSELALRESDERVRFKLQSILSPQGNIANLELNDIIDVPTLQKLMDNFYELVQIPIAIIDITGKVLVGVGWQDICTKFHRVHPQSCTNCIESDIHLTQGIPDGEFRLYKCKNNMWDMATPLIIGGEHKGNLFLGQFFFESEPLDYQLFREQADHYGFDENEYREALDKAPRLNKQMLDHAKAFFLNLARSISQLSYSNIKLARAITQQKQVEDALRESEELLNKAQEIGHLGSWSLDVITNHLTWSEEIYRIFGLQPKELSPTYEGFLEAIHAEDRDAVNSAFTNSLMEGKDSYEIEHRIIRKHSGELRYVWEKGENIRNISGKVVRCIGMVLDITERKQSEVALIENERLLRESQTIAHIGSYSADLINKSWKASPEINEIFGIEESHPHTLDALFEALHPDFREQLAKDLFQVKNEDKHFEHEYKIIRINDGVQRWVQGLGEFEYDSQLNPVRLIGTIQDITERKGKEEALLRLNQTLAALSKSSQAMAQSVNETEYLKQVCQIVVDDTDFAMVWIGFAQDDEAKTIQPMASAGFTEDYLQSINLSWADTEMGRGPIGTAIRTGNMSICNNILTDSAFEPWRKQALKHGYASTIVLPLKTGDNTFGTLSIYSKKPNAFLDVEVQLLSELANDLAHGITTIRLRAAHKLAEETLSKSHGKLEVLVKERTSELQITNNLLKKEIKIGKQQEHSLKLAEEKYRTVADHTHGWEFWLDKDDHFIYCSPSCERITGYKASEFLQNPGLLFDIIHPNDKKSFRDHKKTEDLCQIENHELQYRIIRPDGSMRWIGHECQPITDESGHFMGVRGSNKDITERKEIEQLLKTNNQKYRLLSANISDGIFICKNGCFEYVNKAMNHIFGYANNKMEGLKFTRLALPDYHEELDRIFSIYSSVNQLWIIEIECSRKDNSLIQVEILFNYVAKEKVIYGVVHDITDKKQIQKNMVKAIIMTEEKERAHFSKELHDGLGPLLSTIKLYLQWAARPKANKSREEIIHLAEAILEEALTAVKEISNKLSPHLLDYYGLTSAIQSFVDKLEATSAVKITFKSNTSRRLGNEIEAALYRAIIECINNTIKHAGASNIYIILNDMDNQLYLQYRDDGKGFDIQYIISIKKGLGLFNLQNRIKTIGGKINLFSEPGKGVDYEITLNL